MIEWMRDQRAAWRARSRHAQVEASTRWSLFGLPWLLLVTGLTPLPAQAADNPEARALTWTLLATCVLMCTVASVALPRALAAYLGQRRPPWGVVGVLALVCLLAGALAAALVRADRPGGEAAEGMVLVVVVSCLLMPLCLIVTVRTGLLALAGILVLSVLAFAAGGLGSRGLVGIAVIVVLGGAGVGFSARFSAWYIAVLRELDEAREAQSRLAVAEERLRFGRDMHDVLGRNLSVIALKSELAVQLARRGGEREAAAAVDQMVEVQRIARESQREVREVVRGYREADLTTELAGARGVLRAAGVDCQVHADGGPHLPDAVRAALGWVVREGATNVLRHADAERCAIAVRSTGDAIVLTMENDGVAASCGQDDEPGTSARREGGSGLYGLRERLAALEGHLTTHRPTPTTFRLRAEVPRRTAPATAEAEPPSEADGQDAEAGSGPTGPGRSVRRLRRKPGRPGRDAHAERAEAVR